jgi:formylglycine-generating enzyme required for sulfatase activity
LDNDSVEINIYAIEMVNIPQGAYTLGSGGSLWNEFVIYGTAAATINPYQITSNAAIQVGPTLNNLYYNSTGSGFPNYFPGGGDLLGPIPANFPKGFTSFWIMKYEASQQQYVDFLNNLDLAKATTRNNAVATGSHPAFIAPFPERAMGYLSNDDLCAYADWSGMRPFTEMEYEKACRGANNTPIVGEYPWGNTTITNIGVISYDGLDNETANTGNCNYSGSVPRRCGIFATALSDRQQSGASYYGVMELSGNLWEQTVCLGTPAGRAISSAIHGNGVLDATGNTDVPTWVTYTSGGNISFKGGAFNSANLIYMNVSNRYSTLGGSSRNLSYGMRLARSAE